LPEPTDANAGRPGTSTRLALVLGALAAADLAVGFFIQWLVLATLGPGRRTDALFAGQAIPMLALAVLAGSLMHVLVPILAARTEEGSARAGWTFVALIGCLAAAIALLLAALAGVWVPWVVPGFTVAEQALVVLLTRIQLIGMVFIAVTNVLWSIHHARQRFVWAEAAPLAGSLLCVGLMPWALANHGVVGAAWLLVLRSVLPALLLFIGAGRPTRPDWRSPIVRQSWQRLRPLLIGATYYKIDPVVDRMLSSLAPPGQLSLFHLGTLLLSAATHIVNKAVAAPMVPLLARAAERRDWSSFARRYRARMLAMGLLTGAGLLLLLAVGRPVLALLIGHGGVTRENVGFLWLVMVCLAGYLLGGALGQVLSSAYYAMGDTRTPTRIGVVCFTFAIGLKGLGFWLLGVPGIALASSTYFLVVLGLMWLYLERGLRRAAREARDA
jgi:peptidoglycan biosynthesis protein MviN/MurJ (putative lipid II flippase)